MGFTAQDGPEVQSVHSLGRQKDRYFMQQLEQHGVEVYAPAIALVRALRSQEVRTAVVSSSNNCALVLEVAGIAQLFDARVDGTDVSRLELKGKPASDALLEAARRLVSMGDMHLGALEFSLTAENWSASVTVLSAIDSRTGSLRRPCDLVCAVAHGAAGGDRDNQRA